MTTEERIALREAMISRLRRDVEARGGSVADGFVILLKAALELPTAMMVTSGISGEKGKADFLIMAGSSYAATFEVSQDEFRRRCH